MEIVFETQLSKIGHRQVIRIPLDSSKKLPSRGMVMIQGIIKKIPFKAPLEPDGKGCHWFEPETPKDILDEIEKENLMDQWNSMTTKARWDWIRWIRGAANSETRKKRIKVACSKLQKGDTNPCCFDRTRCTITDVSKSGILLDD